MIILSCPQCHESVRLRGSDLDSIEDAGINDQTQWKCPFCLAFIDAHELTRSLPPLMQRVSIQDEIPVAATGETAAFGIGAVGADLVSDSAATEPGFDPDESVDFLNQTEAVGPGLADEASVSGISEYTDEVESVDDFEAEEAGGQTVAMTAEEHEAMASLEPDEDAEIPEEYQLDGQPETVVSPAPMMDVSDIRRRKKKGGGLKTIIGMVGGGLIAVPLAGGILLGISALTGRQFNFGFYPFDGSFGNSNAQVTASTPFPVTQNTPARETTPPTGQSLAVDLAPPEDASVEDTAQAALAEITGDTSNALAGVQADAEEAVNVMRDMTDPVFEPIASEATGVAEPALAEPPADPRVALLSEIESDLASSTEPEMVPDGRPEMTTELTPEPEPAETSDSLAVSDVEVVDVEPEVSGVDRDGVDDSGFTTKFEEVVDVMRRYRQLAEGDSKRPRALNYAFAQLSWLASQPQAESDAKLGQLLEGIAAEGTLLQKFAPLTPAWISEQAASKRETGVLVVGKIIDQGGEQAVQVAGRKTYPVNVAEGLVVPDNVFVGLGRVRWDQQTQVIDLVRIESR